MSNRDVSVNLRSYTFVGGDAGEWQVCDVRHICGVGLDHVSHVDVVNAGLLQPPEHARWLLRGVTSYGRYTNRAEQESLKSVQPATGRPEATCAALIPISKTAAWWDLTQDERREILEVRSNHIATGSRYLPAVARRLHHCYDLDEPFDFLTWFEYAPSHAAAFDELVAALRETEEWRYVNREVDIRLVREIR